MDKETFIKKHSDITDAEDRLKEKLRKNKEAYAKLRKRYARETFKEFHYGEKVLVKFLGRKEYVEGYIGDMNTIICYSPEKYGDISSFYARVEIYDKNPRGKGYTDLLGTVIFDHIQQGAADIKHFTK